MFHQPGDCDLTVNVDFAFLKEAVSDLRMYLSSSSSRIFLLDNRSSVLTHGPISQADFLNRMGVGVRVKTLKSQASPERADEIEKAAKRLTDLTGMGKQYQVLGFTSDGNPGEDAGPWPFVELDDPAILK